MEGKEFLGQPRNGEIKYSSPISDIFFFSVALGAFLLFLSLALVIGFPFTIVCAFPMYVMIGALVSVWSNSVLSVDTEDNEIVLRRSLIFTPGIAWRTVKRPLTELTGIKLGVNRVKGKIVKRPLADYSVDKMEYERSRPGSSSNEGFYDEYHENKLKEERTALGFRWEKKETLPQGGSHTVDWYTVKLAGVNNSSDGWEMDISSVALGGSNKVPDRLLIGKLCSLLGLPALNLDHYPKKQSIVPMLVIIGILVSPGLVLAVNDLYFQLSDIAILPFIFVPWILAFTALFAYIAFVLVSASVARGKRKSAIIEFDENKNGMISTAEFGLFKQRYFSGLGNWMNKLDAMFASKVSDTDGNLSIEEFVDLVEYIFILLNDRSRPSSPEVLLDAAKDAEAARLNALTAEQRSIEEGLELEELRIQAEEQALLKLNLIVLSLESPEDIICNKMLEEMG